MSFTQPKPARQRVQRCELAVPASNIKMIEKSADCAADFVFLDLEDAVAPGDKVQARKNAIEAVNDIDWAGKGKTIAVRINGLDTHYMYRDVMDALLTQIEEAKGFKNKIAIEAIIETALGMANVEAIAQSSPRLEALHFGVADYSASCRARTVNIGGLNPDYPGDQWHSAISRMVVACRAYGLRPIDGPFGDIKDPEGYTLACRRGAALGIEGKWALHPSQIELANEVFSPPEEEIAKAHRILEELDKAAKEGKGAATLDGKMIDAASAKMAENVVRAAEAIAAKS
ncbi:MAG: CoA ester lyase [Gammaproteobacteria bacterium]